MKLWRARWLPNLSLLSRIWLSTSVALTALFAVTGILFERQVLDATSRSLDDEVASSFRAYESVWRARAEMLASAAAILSSMPNVRAAFGTHDPATIRDTAGELWMRVSDSLKESAFFFVTDPDGSVVAALDNETPLGLPAQWPVVRAVRDRFPRQVSGFFLAGGGLFQLVLTPVYVDAGAGRAVINVLITGYSVNHLVAQRLRDATGSDFLFVAGGKVAASTLSPRATEVLAADLGSGAAPVNDGVIEYKPLVRDLIGLDGRPVGKLGIFRSFETARQHVAELRGDIVLIWLGAMTVGLALSWLLVKRIVEPVKRLDRAAAEVARQNYRLHVEVTSEDELGRLAGTFNSMCASLESARQELIRQERISTIGRMASSIVHDLRNPLAAIYGGAEMMVDTELTQPQMKRLAANVYRASRRIQEMLHDLTNVARGKTQTAETCRLRDVIGVAFDTFAEQAASRGVRLVLDAPDEIELPLERDRVERVFANLVANALEAMPGGGEIRVTVRTEGEAALVEVCDTGPGISREIRGQLFQPFVTSGKRNGLGLGLALSRQAVLDHGGDMWAGAQDGPGARFYVRIPLARATAMR